MKEIENWKEANDEILFWRKRYIQQESKLREKFGLNKSMALFLSIPCSEFVKKDLFQHEIDIENYLNQ